MRGGLLVRTEILSTWTGQVTGLATGYGFLTALGVNVKRTSLLEISQVILSVLNTYLPVF